MQASQTQALGVGIGLRACHYRDFLEQRQAVDWLEVHTENYFAPGGWDLHVLERLRRDYPISLHGVGLGLGTARGFSVEHLQRVVELARRIEPALVSEHLCWGAVAARHMNDLLPMAMTRESLDLMCERVSRFQDALGRQVLIENVSSYLRFKDDSYSEAEFLARLASRTGCGVLLDVNNLYVNFRNHGEDPYLALETLAVGSVGEIHLAGHLVDGDVVVDDHGSQVCDDVWAIYRAAINRFMNVPTLVEWDTDIPTLDVLIAEADKARAIVEDIRQDAPIELADLQQQMAEVIVAQAPLDALGSVFRGPPARVSELLARYRGTSVGIWNNALAAAYPVIRMLVGDEFFEGMARVYGRAYPSRAGDLNQFGADFACFLADFEHVADYPYMPDVARLEWAMHRAHYAEDETPMLPQELALIAPDQFETWRVRLAPACSLLQSAWRIGDIWRAHQHQPVEMPQTLQGSDYLLVVRPAWQAQLWALDAATHAWLSALACGETMGVAVDLALEHGENFDFARSLQQALAQGVFVSDPASRSNTTT